jgi:signal transduction histidine kinase
MLLASGLLMLILSATFAVLLIAVDDLRAAARAAQNSEELLVTANELERLVIDLETGVRGFVLTGEDEFLEPWHRARRNLPDRAAALERQSAANPEQERTARQLALAANAYVEQYAAPLVQAVRRGDPAARSVAATMEGKRRVDAMRVGFDAFIATERRLAQARQGQSDQAARRAVAAAIGGLTVSLLLVLIFAGYLTRAIVRPVLRAAQMAVRLAGGNLSTRMPATGVAEIGQLERAFNDMAGSLERNRDDLAASRARVVAAADETRRRLERDLHDGAQQRLVSLALRLRTAAATVPGDLREVHQELADVGTELNETLGDLRELSRGIHPAILSEGGLGPALRTLARRSSVPVQLQVEMEGRLPERVEVTAYYVVSEALTNVAKHANASAVEVDVDRDDGLVRLAIRDDGVGGADPVRGSGLIGLKDRVEGTGGTLHVESPPGQGTSLLVELPIDAGQPPEAG